VKDIDAALVSGTGYRDLAKRWGVGSISALSRHRREHISPALVAATAAEVTVHGQDLLAQLRGLHGRVLKILDGAEQDGRPSVALSAIREARSLLELTARVTGELDERPQVTINLQSTAEWVELRGMILGALRPHPAAFADVMRVINGPEVIDA
jgi:hypothetical protein